MRLWSLHPKYLDTKGLVALWREGLLAQKVLAGKTRGYKNHPQLIRFKCTKDPIGAIGFYLKEVALEAKKRGYNFNTRKIQRINNKIKIPVTSGQIAYEFRLLKCKLQKRDKNKCDAIKKIYKIRTNTIFKKIPGDIEKWEKVR